jgi:hypothetical protein
MLAAGAIAGREPGLQSEMTYRCAQGDGFFSFGLDLSFCKIEVRHTFGKKKSSLSIFSF